MKDQCPEINLPSMPENETSPKEDPQNQTEQSGLNDQRGSPSTLRRKERDETLKVTDSILFLAKILFNLCWLPTFLTH